MPDEPRPLLTRGEAEARLRRRGYLTGSPLERHLEGAFAARLEPALPKDTPVEDETLARAVVELQKRYGLPATGKVDAELSAFLDEPYCDVPDPPGPAGLTAGGVPWRDPHVTYQYMSWPAAFDQATTRAALRTAFDTWEAVCTVKFSEVTAQGDMRIVFAARAHGDAWPFDGPGHVLAHAFYPDWPDSLRGDLHVDTDEPWVIDPQAPDDKPDLVTSVLHEIGHAIGLPHSTEPASVMWPNYVGVRRTLHASDIAFSRSLYHG